MDLGITAVALSFGAGLASVASPCVLPVVPIIVTGTEREHRLRPALVVLGIATSFIVMGMLDEPVRRRRGHAAARAREGRRRPRRCSSASCSSPTSISSSTSASCSA